MTTYTRRLAAANSGAANVFTTLYTCPPGQVVVVRDLVLTGIAATAARVEVFLELPGGLFLLFVVHVTEDWTSGHLDLRQSLVEGDALVLRSQGPPDSASAVVTGYVFASP